MNNYIEKIKAAIDPLRNQIINHKVYSVIKDIDDIVEIAKKLHVSNEKNITITLIYNNRLEDILLDMQMI